MATPPKEPSAAAADGSISQITFVAVDDCRFRHTGAAAVVAAAARADLTFDSWEI